MRRLKPPLRTLSPKGCGSSHAPRREHAWGRPRRPRRHPRHRRHCRRRRHRRRRRPRRRRPRRRCPRLTSGRTPSPLPSPSPPSPPPPSPPSRHRPRRRCWLWMCIAGRAGSALAHAVERWRRALVSIDRVVALVVSSGGLSRCSTHQALWGVAHATHRTCQPRGIVELPAVIELRVRCCLWERADCRAAVTA